MKSALRFGISILACGFVGLGCQSDAGKGAATKPTIATDTTMQMTITAEAPPSDNPHDPRQQLGAMVHLDIYLLDVPEGTVSQNSEFWKRADEEALGAANEDRLMRNGIRCGIVPRSEGLFFSQFFDKQPHQARRSTVDGMQTSTIQLQMEKQFDHQDLFFFNGRDRLPEGRSYDHVNNQWALTFGPTPRDPGAVRITLCPIVHSEKRKLQFTQLNQEVESPVNDVDRIYDLGLSLDLPGDSFMIVAPSGDAARPSSIGGRFLIKADETEKLEQVILIVPTFLRFDGKPYILRPRLLK